jgi:phosphoglycolate phosphatase
MIDEIDTILFDLDGTLTNPREGIVNSILFALKKLRIREDHINKLDSFIGPPLRDSFAKRYNLNDAMADKAMLYYREYYSAKGIFENILYPGIIEMLELLVSNKYQLYVATSKPTVYAIEVLKHFKLDTYFNATIGCHLDNTRTDKTEIIAHVISTFGLLAKRSIMIGDRKHDIIGAKNNSLKTVGVTYGFGSLEELILHNPDFIVNDCKEIKDLFLE